MSPGVQEVAWRTRGEPNARKIAMAVPNTDPRVSGGRLLMAAQAALASSSLSFFSRMVATSSKAVRSTQRDTSAMVRPVAAAAYSIGASSLVARVSQNFAASCLSSTAAASASQPAVRVAAGKVVEVSSGDQRTEARPVAPVGSNRWVGPSSARRATVRSYTSRLTEVTRAGPSHRRRFGTTSRLVFPVRVGAIAITDVRAGTSTSCW